LCLICEDYGGKGQRNLAEMHSLIAQPQAFRPGQRPILSATGLYFRCRLESDIMQRPMRDSRLSVEKTPSNQSHGIGACFSIHSLSFHFPVMGPFVSSSKDNIRPPGFCGRGTSLPFDAMKFHSSRCEKSQVSVAGVK
jgi:hypothetical protein